jgi:hypothetical protein
MRVRKTLVDYFWGQPPGLRRAGGWRDSKHVRRACLLLMTNLPIPQPGGACVRKCMRRELVEYLR